MMSKKLYTVILAGGSGERFWPKSRKATPKQILPIYSKEPMLKETIRRVHPVCGASGVYVVAGRNIKKAMKRKNIKAAFIEEPCARNTAAAIGLAAAHISRASENGIIAVLPSDQYVKRQAEFLRILKASADFVRRNRAIVTIGIKPDYPSDSFGYIKISGKPFGKRPGKAFYRVGKFIEKPDRVRASRFLKNSDYVWNAGMFVFKAADFLNELKKHMPALYRGLIKIQKNIGKKGYAKVLTREFGKFRGVSVDYGLMEKTDIAYCVKADIGWDDLGLWRNIGRFNPKDKKGNVALGDFCGYDAEGNIAVSRPGHLITACGISDLVIVNTEDATLVCRKEKSSEVKQLLKILKKNKRFSRYL
jgi:mannose-1-phosphate guanylyltransferase